VGEDDPEEKPPRFELGCRRGIHLQNVVKDEVRMTYEQPVAEISRHLADPQGAKASPGAEERFSFLSVD
jgi:hypothetical protein